MFNPGGKVIVGTVVTVMCVDYTRYSLLGNKEVTCPDTKSWSDLPECRLCGRNYSSFVEVLQYFCSSFIEFYWRFIVVLGYCRPFKVVLCQLYFVIEVNSCLF